MPDSTTSSCLDTPVLMLLFNRYAMAERLFARVRAARPSRLYISVDGPRDHKPGEREAVAKVRSIADLIDWPCQVNTRFSEKNLGCRDGVVGGINWFFEQEEMGIILEDDCIPDVSFFPYCAELLDHYRNEPRVMMVSGVNFSRATLETYPWSYYFHKYQLIWGWATWRRAWRHLDLGMAAWRKGARWKFLREHCQGLDEQLYWLSYFNAVADPSEKSIWSYQWLFAMWDNHGLCISPAVNLVTNVGYGQDATHTAGASDNHDLPTGTMEFPLVNPSLQPDLVLQDDIRRRVYMARRTGLGFILGWLVRQCKKGWGKRSRRAAS